MSRACEPLTGSASHGRPEVYAELVNPNWDDSASWSIVQRVLLPLQWFGLLERKDLPPKEPYERPYEVRKTPLFDRFIEFRW